MLEGYLLAIYASYLPFIGGTCPEDFKIDLKITWIGLILSKTVHVMTLYTEIDCNQLEKLVAWKDAYLWLPLITFPFLSFLYLSLPFLPFPYLSLSFLAFPCFSIPSLPFLTFPYLPWPLVTFPYLCLPFLTLLCLTAPYLALFCICALTN